MGKAQAVLDLFSTPYGMREPHKLLRHVVEALAHPLEEADSHLFRIQRAHRIRVAEDTEDILLLAAALNLTEIHFSDLLTDEEIEHDERLRLMRRRVRRVARLHLQGSGTPWAIVEGTSIFLDATVIPPTEGERRMRPIDAERFSHRAEVESDRGSSTKRALLDLHENPRRRRRIEPAARWPRLEWRVRNESVGPGSTRILVRGVGERTVRPAVICPDSGQGILFHGIIPDGATLVLDAAGVRLDGTPVDEWTTFFDGGIHDYSDLDEATAVTERPASASKPLDLERRAVAGSPIRRPRPVPAVPVGASRWFLQVAEGVFGGSEFDCAVFDTPDVPVGIFDGDPPQPAVGRYGEAVFYYPPSAVAGMAWDERIPCAFKLSLPRGFTSVPGEEALPPAWELGAGIIRSFETEAEESGGATTLLAPDPRAWGDRRVASRISTLLTRFKAAGIRSFVEPAQPSWTLGSGVMSSTEARWGGGNALDSTHLADPYRDTLVRA